MPRRSTRSKRWRASREFCRRSSRRTPSRTRARSLASWEATASCSSIFPDAATRTCRRCRRGRKGGMGRIADRFARLRSERTTGLVTYTTAGDPDLPRSAEILRALDRAGADVLEVGVPFSDPLADGPVIQRATERALAAGGSLRASLDVIEKIRPHVAAPIVVFSYANPLL